MPKSTTLPLFEGVGAEVEWSYLSEARSASYLLSNIANVVAAGRHRQSSSTNDELVGSGV